LRSWLLVRAFRITSNFACQAIYEMASSSAAEAVDENRPVIAAVNCSTPARQNRACRGTPAVRHPKSSATPSFSATSEAVPFQGKFKLTHYRSSVRFDGPEIRLLN